MMDEEIFPIVNEDGWQIGEASRSECHSGTFLLHPVVHLHIVNEKNELLLQKRAANKDIQPNRWDTAVGGHIQTNERIEEALKREAKEELGIENFHFQLAFRYSYKSDREHELIHSYLSDYSGNFTKQDSEISDIRFWSFEEIENRRNEGIFTPNFLLEFDKLKELLTKNSY